MDSQIEVRKRDLPDVAIGQTTDYRGTEYVVVDDGGIGPWAYWILRPTSVRASAPLTSSAADTGFPAYPPALAAAYSAPDLEPKPEDKPEIPSSFTQAMKEVEEGNIVPLDDVLSGKPPPESAPPSSEPTPVLLENPEPAPSPATESPAAEPAAPDGPSFDLPTDDNANVC